MATIEWMDSFSVHNKTLDDQHKEWIKIFNRAHGQMMGEIPEDDTLEIGEAALIEMIKYAKFHFSSEEDYMKKIGFPGYEEHKRIHKAFTLKLDEISSQIQEGTFVMNSEIVKVIENWLIDHVLKEDQKYATYSR
ncbi:MAG: hemerythrin family protein [Desulfobacterium sp.]|nr:hemerythrin family protein [Desulfobacterium sp.]